MQQGANDKINKTVMKTKSRFQSQDVAINNLIEQDQNARQDLFLWADPTTAINLKIHKKSSSSHIGSKTPHPRTFFKKLPERQSKRKQYNPQMLQSNQVDASEWMELYQQNIIHQQPQKSFHDIKGSYWWSKVNWTSFEMREEGQTERKSKKISAGCQTSHQNAARKSNRYKMYQKVRDKQYKNNLIYSILKGEQNKIKSHNAKTVHRYQPKNRSMMELPSSKRYSKTPQQEVQMSSFMQDSIRQNLQKFVIKNKEEDNGTVLMGKKEEQRRSSFIRSMLNNIQNMKENPRQPVTNPEISRSCVIRESKTRGGEKKEVLRQVVSMTKDPVTAQGRSRSTVIDINAQAQRVYKNRSVNRRYAHNAPLDKF